MHPTRRGEGARRASDGDVVSASKKRKMHIASADSSRVGEVGSDGRMAAAAVAPMGEDVGLQQVNDQYTAVLEVLQTVIGLEIDIESYKTQTAKYIKDDLTGKLLQYQQRITLAKTSASSIISAQQKRAMRQSLKTIVEQAQAVLEGLA